MTEWSGGDEPYYTPRDNPGPSRRREDGILDFRNGLKPRSDDRFYMTGYDLAKRIWGRPAADDAAVDGAAGT